MKFASMKSPPLNPKADGSSEMHQPLPSASTQYASINPLTRSPAFRVGAWRGGVDHSSG